MQAEAVDFETRTQVIEALGSSRKGRNATERRQFMGMPLFNTKGANTPRFSLVRDPSHNFRATRQTDFAYGEFEDCLWWGIWPPGSVWECAGVRYIVRGNEMVPIDTPEDDDRWLPQHLERAS